MIHDVDLRIRLTQEEKLLVENKAKELHFRNVSEYVRFVITNCYIPKNMVTFNNIGENNGTEKV